MTPFDPLETTGSQPHPTVPPFIDQNPNRDLVMEGSAMAEQERSEAADDEFGEDPSLPPDDSFEEIAPEVAALHDFDPGTDPDV